MKKRARGRQTWFVSSRVRSKGLYSLSLLSNTKKCQLQLSTLSRHKKRQFNLLQNAHVSDTFDNILKS